MLFRFASFLLLIAGAFVPAAHAMVIRSGGNVVINAPVEEDVYIAGGTVNINAPIHGDLIVAGGTVYINDTITGDVLVGGGDVTFNGYAADDVRAAGGQITILRFIAGDLLVLGAQVIVEKNAAVAGDVVVSSGDIRLEGRVGGMLRADCGSLRLYGVVEKSAIIRSNDCYISGTIGGDARFTGASLEFGEAAKVRGQLRYWMPEGEADLDRFTGNGAVFDPSLPGAYPDTPEHWLGWAAAGGILWYLVAMMLVIALLIFFFPLWLRRSSRLIERDVIQMFTTGFLFLLAFPATGIILLLTIIGIPVGAFLILAFVLMLSLSNVLSAALGAFWIRERYNYHWPTWKMILASLAILIVLRLLFMIPYAGWVIKLIAVSIAFGSLYNAFKERRSEGGFSF